MRDGERKPVATMPPAAGPVVARVQPGTVTAAVRAEQVRVAVGVLNRIVHRDDPGEAHRLDLLVREHHADEAGDLGGRLREPTLVGLGTDQRGDPSVVREELALQDGDVRGDAERGLEVLRAEDVLRPPGELGTLGIEVDDPLLAGPAIRGDAEGDDAVLLAPAANRCGDGVLVAEECIRRFFSPKFVDDRVEPCV